MTDHQGRGPSAQQILRSLIRDDGQVLLKYMPPGTKIKWAPSKASANFVGPGFVAPLAIRRLGNSESSPVHTTYARLAALDPTSTPDLPKDAGLAFLLSGGEDLEFLFLTPQQLQKALSLPDSAITRSTGGGNITWHRTAAHRDSLRQLQASSHLIPRDAFVGLAPGSSEVNPEFVNAALEVLRDRLSLVCDIVNLVPRQMGEGTKKEYTRVRWGAFLLGYAALEGYFNTISGVSETTRTKSPNLDSLVTDTIKRWPSCKLNPNSWTSWTRGPGADSGTNLSEWRPVRGKAEHLNYLTDLTGIRNQLAHGSEGYLEEVKSTYLWPTKTLGYSLRLMGVEGFIRFAEDLASNIAIDLVGPKLSPIDWPMPTASGVSDEGTPARPKPKAPRPHKTTTGTDV